MTPHERKRLRERAREKRGELIPQINGLIQETERVREVAEHSREYLDELDRQFSEKTGLNKLDYSFLFLATGLQVARWILSKRIGEGFDPNDRKAHNDSSIKAEEKTSENKFSEDNAGKEKSGKHKDWPEIIADGVPFDTINGAKDLDLGLSGTNHRLKTLGHDPILGWVFGTANIMTDTCTLATLSSYRIIRPQTKFGNQVSITSVFDDAFGSTMENKVRLAAAVIKEGIHLQSDRFTKIGLPAIPGLSVIAPNLAQKLSAMHYDNECFKRDLGTIGKQAAFSMLINMIIGMVHELFYDPVQFPDHDLYEVKTRKILLYSNLIASASNLLYVGVASACGDGRAWQKLDIGGLAVTLYRLITDVQFITRVKEEFIMSGFDRLIMGDEPDFNHISGPCLYQAFTQKNTGE